MQTFKDPLRDALSIVWELTRNYEYHVTKHLSNILDTAVFTTALDCLFYVFHSPLHHSNN